MSPLEILFDFRGCAISGATPKALGAFERALAAFQSWRAGADDDVAIALREAPSFVMAHVLQAYLYLSSRDPAIVRSARPILARAMRLPANARERIHLAAIDAALADDYERAKTLLGELLRDEPRDVLALQVAHSFDYLTGDVARMRDRVARVLPAWPDIASDVAMTAETASSVKQGAAAVSTMFAFSLEESGDYERAEALAKRALALNPLDARAHHVLAHVFEMTRRPAEGVRWLREHRACWEAGTTVATHLWWHLALFHLALGQVGEALSIYDTHLRIGPSRPISDLIDATALLWRIELQGNAVRRRQVARQWAAVADAWTPHITDGFCTFNDLHAMLAFVGARRPNLAQRLEDELATRQSTVTRHGETTRLIGLPASRALMAFGRGDYRSAIDLLGSLPESAHRIGGSHAQRDVLQLTLLAAVDNARGPLRRIATVPGISARRGAPWRPAPIRYRPTAA